MVKVRYMLGFCRLYGIPFHPQVWTEVNNTIASRVSNSDGWEVEGQDTEESTEVVDESIDLSTLSKAELKALCDEQGIVYKSLDTKATLISFLQTDDEEE